MNHKKHTFLVRVCLIAALTLLWLDNKAQQTARSTTNGTGYLEYLPPDYATNTNRKYPLLIFLHGSGETGSGSAADLEKVKANGPPKMINQGNNMCFTVNGQQECFIVLSPQLGTAAGGWWPSILQPFFNYVMNGPMNYRIDKTRVYLTGLSLGGQGVYIGLGETTDIFAAGAVVAGFDNGNGCIISSRKTAVWGFHGEADGTITYSRGLTAFNNIVNCTNPAPTSELKWTSYPNVGHNAWDNAYRVDNSLHTPNLYQWLLGKSKIPGNAAPTANAGADLSILLPTATVTINGSGVDNDGTIASYAWSQVSGPSTASLTGQNSQNLTASNLAAGTYVFRLTVTDNLGSTGTDDVNVFVNAAGSNLALGKPAFASSFENGNSSTFGAARAVDGNPTSTRWSSAVADPQWIYVDLGATYNINRVKITWEAARALNYQVQSSADAATWTTIRNVTNNQTLVNDLTSLTGSGRYVRVLGTARGTIYGYSIFELEVYGSQGSPNLSPSANAGGNKSITLPVNSVVLNGTGSDTDGTISSFNWSQVSGPSTATLTGNTTATLTASSLAQGSYVFRLTVTDNLGATGSNDATITVNAANLPPTANAGGNRTITLPSNSITLSGSGTDQDGNISAFAWSQVSGPSTATLSGSTTASLTASVLVQGTYVFRLTVTDNVGATGTNDATVTVNPANVAPTANAGGNKTITLPANSVVLNGSGIDTDGTIASFSWTQISGPGTATLTGNTTSNLTASSLVQGTYVFRLTVTDNQGATGANDATVSVNPAATSTNLALNRPTFASSIENNNPSFAGPAFAVDGNTTTTRWSSLYADPQWIYVDLGATFTVTRVKITWEQARALDYLVQVSADATTWSTVRTVSANSTLVNDLTGLSASGRYVRIFGTARATIYGYSIYELEVYGNSGTVNNPPVAGAGGNKVISLPANSVTLNGSGTDSDGTVAAFAWNQVSGPTTASLTGNTTQNLTASGLTQGTYVFRLTVTDNLGATGTSDASVLVNAPPTADAGGNRTVTLPTNNITLNGSATDSDGTIAGLNWSQISGPNTAALSGNTTATLTAASLIQGTYVFRLTATDNQGATGANDVTVTVNPANVPPTVSSGGNRTITLPANNVTLTGAASDSDGTITSTLWTQTSGPNSAALSGASTLTLGVSGMIAGTYVFRLTATDNSGATSFNDASVIVNPDPNSSNLALNRPAVASSFENGNSSTFGAQFAVDGNATSTRWSSAYADPQWIYVDLGATYTLTRVKITWEQARANSYKIQVSADASAWSDIFSTNSNSTTVNDVIVSGSGRYVRVLGLTRATTYGYSIFELEVYGSSAAARMATKEVAAAPVQVEVPSVKVFTFLGKDYPGDGYSVLIFDEKLQPVYSGAWTESMYNDILKPGIIYYYTISRSGSKVATGKVKVSE